MTRFNPWSRIVCVLGLVVLVTSGTVATSTAASAIPVHCENGDSLQQAIDNATAGRTLSVTGTCVGNFGIGKNLKLTSNTALGTVRLDGNHTGSVVTVSTGAAVTITGFTITNGRGDYDPALDIQTGGRRHESGQSHPQPRDRDRQQHWVSGQRCGGNQHVVARNAPHQ